MGFRDDAWPQRMNRGPFVDVLLRNLSSWQAVTPTSRHQDGSNIYPGGERCQIQGTRHVCSYAPTSLDRRRIEALLKAWKREISDRYLDLAELRRLSFRRFSSEHGAFEQIRQNAPSGAVCFLRDKIESEIPPNVLFGRFLGDDLTYDMYFSRLLNWDDKHCYGAFGSVRAEMGGRTGPSNVWRAARDWLNHQYSSRVGVYSLYNLRLTALQA